MRFGDKNAQFPQVEVISTGSLALDHALGASPRQQEPPGNAAPKACHSPRCAVSYR